MNKKIKVVLVDDNRALCQMLGDYLTSQEDIYLAGIGNNGVEALDLVKTHEPDLLILDLVMPNLDGLAVLERLNAGTYSVRPKVMVLTAFGQESLAQQAMSLGVDYFILKPFELDILGKRIRQLNCDPTPASRPAPAAAPATLVHNPSTSMNLGVEVTNMMHQIGIPAHVKGYQYIRDAILAVVEDVTLLGAVTKELYPMIAKKYDTAPSRVERGIRHAIELAWERGHTETLKRIFGYSLNIERQKPTNSEFIALLADKLRVMSKVS